MSQKISAQLLYYRRNRKKVLARQKRYYSRHRKRILKRMKKYARRMDWIGRFLRNVRKGAKKRGLRFELTRQWLTEQLQHQQGRCYWTGLRLKHKDLLRMPSLDRLDNNKGYVPNNVVLATLAMNTARRESTIGQFQKFLREIGIKREG